MQKLPGDLVLDEKADLHVLDYDLDRLMNRSKIVLEQYVISFLLGGHKELNFAGSTIYEPIDLQKKFLQGFRGFARQLV